jgi:predicted secreted Zn-dependent protease
MREGRCVVVHAKIEMETLFTFPLWYIAPGTPADLQAKWTAYMRGLEIHEKGHQQITLNEAHEILKTVAAQRADSCAALKETVRAVVKGVQDRWAGEQRAYDARTRHGVTQGATLR